MAHENHHVVPGNGPHEYTREKGYVAKEHEHQEYPKVVEHEAGKEPVVVHSEEQERAHKARKLKAEAQAAPAKAEKAERIPAGDIAVPKAILDMLIEESQIPVINIAADTAADEAEKHE